MTQFICVVTLLVENIVRFFSCALILICILLFRENKKQRKKCGHVKIGVTKSDNEEWAKQRETTKKMT